MNGYEIHSGGCERRTRLKGSAALWLLLAGFASPALAQTADQPAGPPPPAEADPSIDESEGEEIVVTGFRGSLSASLNVKRNANGVVDVIKAEDIAEFPDNNLAESIQRIPGVTITRDQGEGRNIAVRGLGPIYTQVRINGLEGLGTTGGADDSGGANRTRAFDFNIFASDLFNTIIVRKTPSADVRRRLDGRDRRPVDRPAARIWPGNDDRRPGGGRLERPFTLDRPAIVGADCLANAG